MDENTNIGIDTGVENEVVAAPEPIAIEATEPVQEVEPKAEAQPIDLENNVAKIVAKRLSSDREKMRAELEREYATERKILERGAKENGMTLAEYKQALLAEEAESTEDSTIPPEYKEILDELKTEKENKRKADADKQDEEATNAEVNSYAKQRAAKFIELGITTAEQIPPEVWARVEATGGDVLVEYLLWDKEQSVKQAEQKTIEKLQKQGTPGSLSANLGGSSDVDIFAIDYNSKEFDAVYEKYKRTGKL